MSTGISRRDLLKIGLFSLGACAAAPLEGIFKPGPPEVTPQPAIGQGRVTTRLIYCYALPNFKSKRLGTYKRDLILPLFEEVQSPDGPRYNPLWYRTSDGYIHSAHVQRVEKAQLNTPASTLPEGGQLGEITVPISQSLRPTLMYGWTPLYRLYYESVHWVTSLEQGPDDAVWYGITDELLHVKYCVPATHVRLIDAAELMPLSQDVPARDKRIRVSLAGQVLLAYEKNQVVYQAPVSTGIPNGPTEEGELPTATPKGRFYIQLKMPSKHMGDGALTDEIEAYELVGVPWVCFFHSTGVAFHGTYWHSNFGTVMSHGCVNLRNVDAKWLYRWTVPIAPADEWLTKGYGTLVQVE